jgi:hypothetical protein
VSPPPLPSPPPPPLRPLLTPSAAENTTSNVTKYHSLAPQCDAAFQIANNTRFLRYFEQTNAKKNKQNKRCTALRVNSARTPCPLAALTILEMFPSDEPSSTCERFARPTNPRYALAQLTLCFKIQLLETAHLGAGKILEASLETPLVLALGTPLVLARRYAFCADRKTNPLGVLAPTPRRHHCPQAHVDRYLAVPNG